MIYCIINTSTSIMSIKRAEWVISLQCTEIEKRASAAIQFYKSRLQTCLPFSKNRLWSVGDIDRSVDCRTHRVLTLLWFSSPSPGSKRIINKRQKCPFSIPKKRHFERPNLRTDSKNLAKHPPKWWGRLLVHAFPFSGEYQANF